MSSNLEVVLALKVGREANLSLLNFHSLIAAVAPTSFTLLEKMNIRLHWSVD